MSVFVVDQQHQPLMPCSERRARLLLSRGRAVVHRRTPLVIRLKDRRVENSCVQPVALKLDPGSVTTGMALVRMEQTEAGERHHALHLAELTHRGHEVHQRMGQRKGYRRRRRSANLRYHAPRWRNRRRASGWLAPSLRSRMGNVLTWARRYQRWVPLTRIEVERVKFDLARMQHPDLGGIEYQRGELFGWEVRCYLLEKYQRRCVYCGRTNVPFEIDHVLPRSRGGSNRVSNLVLSCHSCNQAKDNQTAGEFGHPEVQAQASKSLADAAAVNATRFALVEALRGLHLPIGTWSGGRTRWNRDKFQIKKTHAHDALCVGEVAEILRGKDLTLTIKARVEGAIVALMWMLRAFPGALSPGTSVSEASPQGIWCVHSFLLPSKPQGCMWGELLCALEARFGWASTMASMRSIVCCCKELMATNIPQNSIDYSRLAYPPAPRRKACFLPIIEKRGFRRPN